MFTILTTWHNIAQQTRQKKAEFSKEKNGMIEFEFEFEWFSTTFQQNLQKKKKITHILRKKVNEWKRELSKSFQIFTRQLSDIWLV